MSSCALLWLTKHQQRALVEAVSCWGDGGAAVVTNGRLSEAWRGYGDGGGGEVLGGCGGALASEGGAGKRKWSTGWSGRAQVT